MKVNPYHLNAYVQGVSRSANRTGASVDLTAADTAPTPSARPLSGPRSTPEVGALQNALTPEESRFIADLFPRQEGGTGGKAGQGYTHAGRPRSGSVPGIRMDLKG
jgi:hypothetical protein